jgi:hypothetical protein
LLDNHEIEEKRKIDKKDKKNFKIKEQLTRELGVSGSVSERRAEGEVGRSDILGPAFSEKSAT